MSSIISAAGDASGGKDEPTVCIADTPKVLSPTEEGVAPDSIRRESSHGQSTSTKSGLLSLGGDLAEEETREEQEQTKIQAGKDGNVTSREERAFHLRESERLEFFTDAVVAIAATLLILPLMEAATSFGEEESRRRTEEVGAVEEEAGVATAADFFGQHGDQVVAFYVNFWVVASMFWVGHAFLFTYVEYVSIYLYIGTMVWILSVVFFPISASLFMPDTSDTTASLIYLGAVWANSILILALKILIRRDPRTWTEEYGSPSDYSLFRSIVTVGIGAVTMVVGGTVPNYGWLSMLLYLLSRPIQLLILKCRPQLKQKTSAMDAKHNYYLHATFISEIRRYWMRKAKERHAPTNDSTEVADSQHVERKEEASSNGSEEHVPAETNNTETNGMPGKKSVLLLMSDRLIIFTDATVAISMTLLIIPLMEKSSELENSTASEFFAENGQLCYAFVLSFFIVASRWLKHDNMFAFIEGHVPADFMVFNTPWLLSIAFMPVATALLIMDDNVNDRSKYGVYLGTILFNLLVSVALAFIVHRENKNFPPRKVLQACVVAILGALGLLIAMLVPSTGYYMPMLTFFSHPATSLLLRIWPNLQHLVVQMA